MDTPAWHAIDPAVLLDAVGGDVGAYRELCDTFIAIAPALYVRLLQALDGADRRAVAHASHALKGSTILVGAHKLSAVLHRLELLAAQSDGPLLVPVEMAVCFEQVMLEVAASRTAANTFPK